MSAPGFTNLNTPVGYSMNSTPNGGAAPPYQNGPVGQTYPSTYPSTGYYDAGPQQQGYPTISGHCAPAPNKSPIMNNDHSAYYHHNSHQQPTAAPTVAPSAFGATQSSYPPPQPYGTPTTLPTSAAPPNPQHAPPFQQPTPYAPHGAYYGQQQYPTTPSCPGAPLYPIISYPSAPGSSQYGTLCSSQAPTGPGAVSNQIGAPLHQCPPGNGTSHLASTAVVPSGYSMAPPGQPATVNGQVNAVQASVLQHYDQSHQAAMAHDHYGGGVTHNTGGADRDRPPSGAPSTSVHSSPGHQQGGDSSSTTTGSVSPVPNSYDSLEGGSYPESSIPPSADITKQAPPFGYGYPSMQPAYQQRPSPRTDSSPSHGGYNQTCYQHLSQPFPNMCQLSAALGGLSGVPELEVEALRPVNLLQERNLLPHRPLDAPEPNLNADLKKANCSPDTFRCTLNNIPQTQALLNKARLPLGLLLHPFRDLAQLPVITSNTIVRCRSCRTYINPFVSFLDQRRWKCNLCFRVNDVPDEFMYNPVTRSYGEPHKRPEVQNSTVEFIASSDYMLRPPQPAVYLFVLDVSHNAVDAGYLNVFCQTLLENLDKMPGDTRTRVGFITFNSTIQFYNLHESLSQPQMLVVSDIDDIFIPTHDSLLVNLKESRALVRVLLTSLPSMFSQTRETHSALGPALQAAYKLMSSTGGRVSVFQTQLPTLGAGLLQSREDPNQRSSNKGVQHLGPATDFYKKLALDCSGQQIGVDLFLLSSQYSDLASIACVSKYSAGSIFYYPSLHHVHNPAQLDKFQKDLERYLTRKIGFEAVMRIRCTKGLSIHTFHGNFFVRSTDLLSLANVNPDSGFAVQMSIEDSLADTSLACFQAALLYTSSKGKRRIRVHTLCLPVVSQLSDVYAGADVQAITCLLANMAIDRSISSSLSDARDALVNAVVDSLSAYKNTVSNLQQSGLIAPAALCLFPLYVLALLKQKALRTGTSTKLDERVFAMCEFKSQPLQQIMRMVHPDLYRLDTMSDQGALHLNDCIVPQPHLLHLTAEKLTREGAFLMDCGSVFYLWIGKCCNEMFIRDVLGCPNHASIPPNMTQIPELETPLSERLRTLLAWLQDSRTFSSTLHVVTDDASAKTSFFQHLVEDRSESTFSYYEFLLHIQQQMSK
ncbi:protein transport protein Sec24B isoform X2 [Coregonus clupeaformis]|uniref:protein transport protein Sec24B isoform X2 n=1 Tax=Coregonus clupeaformis TaxID=59861 RepID=UPI001E1C4DA0|nr:protein transport protein Sec24B isoform X2 [Coregonus clupeaformis]